MIKRTLYHFHFCCGLGGGAAQMDIFHDSK